MKRIPLVVVASLTSLLVLSGCSSSSQSSPSSGTSRGDQSSGIAEDGAAKADAQVITTGWVSISVLDPVAASADAIVVVEKHGGHVDNRSEQAATDSQPASAQLTVRVPQDDLTDTLAELKKLGTVDSVSISATDVTAQTTDLDARVKALQGSVDRLLDLMSRATDINDLIALETAISSRQADLDSLKSQRDSMADQVAYSTIDLQLNTAGGPSSGGPKNFFSGLVVGWNSLVAAANGSLIALGIVLPWLLVAGVFTALVLGAIRLGMRGSRGPKAKASPDNPA